MNCVWKEGRFVNRAEGKKNSRGEDCMDRWIAPEQRVERGAGEKAGLGFLVELIGSKVQAMAGAVGRSER